jgi:hypothetical protein
MRKQFRQLRKVPLFPIIPIVPALLLGGSFVLSILSFIKVRRLSGLVAPSPQAEMPA